MNIKFKGSGLKAKVIALATAVTVTGAVAFLPLTTLAQQTSADVIAILTAQIAALQAQLLSLSGGGSTGGTTAGACSFTRDLSQGSTGNDVMCLQKFLNGSGYQVSASGAGSPGSESSYFGAKTKMAVSKWQSAMGISPTAGYFGAKSRAKYASMGGVVIIPPTPMPSPMPAPGPTPPPGTPPPAPAGSGLTVAAAAQQPDASLAPVAAARLPYTKVMFTASSDGDVTVKSVTVERQGLADDDAFDSIVLIDENQIQVGLSKTLNANHQVMLNEPFVVKAGTSREMTIAGNMETASGSNAGQVAYLAVVAVDAGTSTVNASFPIKGNGMTINESLTIGSLASPTVGVHEPGAARSSLDVGTTGFFASGVRWTVGSAEPVSLEQIRWYQAGSAGAGDITNVKATVNGTDYPAVASSDGKYYTAKFSPAIVFDKGANIDIGLKLDVTSGSDRTIDFDVLRRTDIVVKGNTFHYYIIAAAGTATNSSTQGEGFTTGEPYYDAYAHTISKGSLRVEKSNAVVAGNVPVSVSNVKLGAFGIEAKGEPIQVSSFKVSFVLSAGEDGTQMTNVSIYDENGAVVAGPKDVNSSEAVTFTDTWTVPIGYHSYTMKGKLSTDFEDGDTVQASIDPDGDITARGQTTGLSITPTPTSSTTAVTMTIRRSALNVSMATTPSAQNVVRGINGFLFAKVQYDAGSSGEDLRITKQDLTLTPAVSADPDDLNNCQMFDGATVLTSGGNVVNPTGAASTAVKMSFSFDSDLIIPVGVTKLIDVKCNISSNAVSAGTYQVGLTAATGNDTTVVGKDTGTAVTESTTNSAGQTMTIKTGGTITVALDSSSPSERYGIFGKADVQSTIFRLDATNEDVKLTKFGFNLASSTASTSDVMKVTFWDGATKVGEGVFTGSNYYATSTFTSDFIVPKDGYKLLNTKIDLVSTAGSAVGKVGLEGEDSGHLVTINWAGGRTTATEGVGMSSSNTINTTAAVDTAAKGVRVVKTYPTLERLSVPSNTIVNQEMVLYRFKVTADAAGDVGLYKVQFRISSTTAATTSLFKLYSYSDSAFSTAAYAANPVNANDVDCVGSSSLETGSNDTCTSDNPVTAGLMGSVGQMGSASSSQIAIFFDPVQNNASQPTAEAINVPAGQSRYFELRGTVSQSASGDAFSVALLGDNTFRSTSWSSNANSGLATPSKDPLDLANNVATSSNFVWSPNTTSTSATTTTDWLSGYLIPGLPSTEMTQQSFSK